MRGLQRVGRFFRKLKKRIGILGRKYPHRVQCNACGWNGRVLASDSWHPHTICPNCGSQVRHRLLFAATASLAHLGIDALVRGKRVLHFAPEAVVARLLMPSADRYVTADFLKDKVDLRLDMSSMRSVADGSFDLLVACDVLEHVPDDSAALREVHRVLSMQGWAILTVPQKDLLPAKYEDPAMATPEQRERAFGQHDHLRIYGDDFGQFLESHGFAVTAVDASSFDAETVKRHVLFPPILSDHPLATNRRKVFFARKKSA